MSWQVYTQTTILLWNKLCWIYRGLYPVCSIHQCCIRQFKNDELKKNINMGNYTDDQLSDFQDSFALFDKKGDGKISCAQIGEVLRALGLNPLLSEIKKLQKEIDPIGEKRLSFDDFLPIYHEQKEKQPSGCAESFIEAFRIFDLDNNGLISAGEVRHLLTMLGEKLTNEEVDALLQGIEDASGKIHYEDFVNEIVKS